MSDAKLKAAGLLDELALFYTRFGDFRRALAYALGAYKLGHQTSRICLIMARAFVELGEPEQCLAILERRRALLDERGETPAPREEKLELRLSVRALLAAERRDEARGLVEAYGKLK